MSDTNLKELCAPVLNGEESIEKWWERNESVISAIKEVDSVEDVIIWSAMYYRYGMHLYDANYSKQSLPYVNKAIGIVENHKEKLYGQLYNDSLETMLEAKAGILLVLGKYGEAYRVMSTLCSMYPMKEDYAIKRKHLISLSISKIVNPIYIVLILIWAVMLCEAFLTHTQFIPPIVWTIAFVCWMVLLFVQFVVPPVANKIQSLLLSVKQKKSL